MSGSRIIPHAKTDPASNADPAGSADPVSSENRGTSAVRVAIVGAGAVGLGLGSFLLDAGASVRFVVRNARERQILTTAGLSRVGLFGESAHGGDAGEAFALAPSIETLRGARLDFLLVCTKTTSSAEVANALAEIWSDFAIEPKLDPSGLVARHIIEGLHLAPLEVKAGVEELLLGV